MIDKNLYYSLRGDERRVFLFNLDENLDADSVIFLLEAAKDPEEYDLARIEAIEILGLYAARSDFKERVIISSELILLAKNDDDDDDVRIYALQSLGRLSDINEIPSEIRDILLNESEYSLVREAAYSAVVSQKDNPDSKKILNSLIGDATFGQSAVRDLK